MSKRLSYFLKKHKPILFDRERDKPPIISNDGLSDGECIPESTVYEGRDVNCFPLDKGKCLRPDDRVWSSASITEYDDYFTR